MHDAGPVRAPRIIPARAGFTHHGLSHAASGGDHPRSRGVYQMRRRVSSEAFGSSPLARGLPDRNDLVWPDDRIIPARAGFTCAPGTTGRVMTDHPRSRGVYAAILSPGANGEGSSPLARGLPASVGSGTPKTGIIPARAGFTHRASTLRRSIWDHPRSRGVYVPLVAQGGEPPGSSPLARGLPHVTFEKGEGRRIIPARAGFT